MKLALRYIPTEVWVDVFRYPWISRRKLGGIVHKYRNRQFAEFLQFYLHDWGKRTLKTLCLGETLFGIPRTPLPDNIKFFEKIEIWHFDSRSLDFLHQIRSLFIFNEVNLHLPNVRRNSPTMMANVRTILGHLSPMLHGIHSLSFNHSAIPLMEQYFGQKLAQVKMLTLDLRYDPAAIQTANNFCLNWLTSEERDSAEPRFLKVYIGTEKNCQQFSMAVRQQFLSARSPCTFAIELLYCDNNDQVTNFHEENSLGEHLDGQFNERSFAIYRHKLEDSARIQLEEWVKGVVEKEDISSGIELYCITTIGQIEANSGANEVKDNVEEEADQQSSTSKK